MANYQKLFVWQESVEIAVTMLHLSKRLAARRQFAIADQIVRASLSVPSNIAEGQGRSSTADRRHFFVQARGSLYELETQLEVIGRARLARDISGIRVRIRKVSAGLSRIIRSLDDSKT